MKIKLNRKYTEDYQIDRVKADMKEFKESFTEADLLNIFRDAAGFNKCGDIIKMDVEAFDAGSYYGEETSFHVDILLDGYSEMTKISYYADKYMNITEDLITIRTFKEVER